MAYRPGSFSKNFAWRGKGLHKLHAVIRKGFRGSLTPVERQRFRDESGLGASLSLIPVNFFLNNLDNELSVDELVFQAIRYAHSAHFDRLALFAFHLNRVGVSSQKDARPAMWANEFVRERLWLDGVWQSSALSVSSLDDFLKDRIRAQEDVKVKCRSNYRHLYELCEFLPSPLPVINSGAVHWFRSSMFLAWDRHVLAGGSDDSMSLLGIIDEDELYKLLGLTREYTLARANDAVGRYFAVGGVARFTKRKTAATEIVLPSAGSASDEQIMDELAIHEMEEEDAAVHRRTVERQEQQRDQRKAAVLKQYYGNTCMFCEVGLEIGDGKTYSEAAHIKALGKPHNGPDKKSNMLVLCPNHHLQFDRGVLRLHRVGEHYRIKSKSAGDTLNGKLIKAKHRINESYVKYHHDWHK